LGKRGLQKLTPRAVYYYMHNPRVLLPILFQNQKGDPWKTADKCWELIDIAWITPFLEDHSGRSSAKTYNHILISLAKMSILPGRTSRIISLDARRGKGISQKYVEPKLEECPVFSAMIKPLDSKRGAVLRKVDNGVFLPYLNRSDYRAYTVDWQKEGLSASSDRCNHLVFNEWTGFPNPDDMVEHVEPIATDNNYMRFNTMMLRESIERALQERLGKLSDEILVKLELPRDYFHPEIKPLNFEPARDLFYENFKRAFQFDYREGEGIKELDLPPIKSQDDLINFFSPYLDGDPVYSNQIVYDGSAKRPSDPCHSHHTWFQKKVLENDPRYHVFHTNYKEIGRKWNGIIYDTNVISKYRSQNLEEDYKRVWLGLWTEGTHRRPFSREQVEPCCSGDIKFIFHRTDDSIFVFGGDAAHGTEAKQRGRGNVNYRGRGDDAGGVTLQVGSGTAENPHKLVNIYKAEDVDSDFMAHDIHKLYNRYIYALAGLDPNGGGGQVMKSLRKSTLTINDQEFDYTGEPGSDGEPLTLHDFIGTEDDVLNDNAVKCFIYMSRGERLLVEVHREKPNLSPFTGEDVLLGLFYKTLRTLLEKGGIVFPEWLDPITLNGLHNHGKINKKEFKQYLLLHEMLDQLTGIQYVEDRKLPTADKRVRTSHGEFKYTSAKKKDLALALMYAVITADAWVKLHGLPGEENAFLPSLG